MKSQDSRARFVLLSMTTVVLLAACGGGGGGGVDLNPDGGLCG